MTDELHNHIAGMVCETDAIKEAMRLPVEMLGKQTVPPADVTALIDLALNTYRTHLLYSSPTEQRPAAVIVDLVQALADATQRAKAAYDKGYSNGWEDAKREAEVLVAELTAKLEAPVQVDAAHIREAALWEAAQVLSDEIDLARIAMPQVVPILAAVRRAILALIPTPAPSPDVPTPPDGWNVMKLGQVGWHVVQSANGWETSRIFGAECLLRSGGGDEFGPALDATPDGGRVAADAPTPSPDVGALAEAAEGLARAGDILRAWDAENIQHQGAGRVAEVMADVANRCDLLRAALAKLKGGAE